MDQEIKLLGMLIENIRGFSHTFIPLDKPLSIFVGANNAGKTSIFKVLQWVFSIDPDDLSQGHSSYLNKEELDTLRPARNVRNKASRISLRIRVIDGRRRRKFEPDGSGVSTLRLNFKLSNRRFYVSISKPSRGEKAIHTANGIDLLRLLLSNYNFVYISPNRIGSDVFQEYSLFYMSNSLRNKPGPPSNPRKHFIGAVDGLSHATTSITADIKRLVMNRIPNGYLRDLSIHYDLDTDSLISWIASRVIVEASTGPHDKGNVSIKELGTGLLALITLLLQGAWAERDPKTTILAIEEPEAFLHPPAQRTLAQNLFTNDASNNTTLLVSTHSPIIVEEANYCSTHVISAHKVYQATCTESTRDEINSAFLSGHGAEMLFYNNILLVEGEADYLFFYALLRRLARYDNSGILNDIKIVPAGGNERFAPWIRLLASFSRSPTDRPFKYLILADGDSPRQVSRAALDAELDTPAELVAALNEVSTSFASYNDSIGNSDQDAIDAALQSWINSCRRFNKVALTVSFPFRLIPGDLEYMLLEHIDDSLLKYLCNILNANECTKHNILRRLGSKASGSRVSSDAKKQPWIRQKIGERLNSSMVQGSIQRILIDILQTFNIHKANAKRILEKLG